MNRRTVLAGTGIAIASFAGCIDRMDDDGRNGTLGNGTPDNSPTETGSQRLSVGVSAEFDDGTSLAVAEPTVQKSIIADHSTFLAIEREDGLQFVVVDVDGDADFESASFVLERDGDFEEPPQIQQHVRGVVRTCENTCIAVPVVAEAVDSLAIAYRTDDGIRAVWDFEDATVAALSEAPDLRLQDASFVDEDGDVGIELTVENTAERDGGFRALVAPSWMNDVEDPVGFPVPQDETVTETVVPSEIQTLAPGEAEFADEPTEDTRYFEIDSLS